MSIVDDVYGTKEHVDIKLSDFFKEVFKRHSYEDAERTFISGTSLTRPDMADVVRTWDKPWVFSRVLAIFTIVHLLCLFIAYRGYIVPYPSVMVIGSFAVPVACMIFSFEANAPRDFSLADALLTFSLGGVSSLLITVFLQKMIPAYGAGTLVPSLLTALIEETAKFVIVAFVLSRHPGRCTILRALAVGCAVGAGFAAFESAGYAFNSFITSLETYIGEGSEFARETYLRCLYTAQLTIVMRGIFAISGHVAWAAAEGAGMSIACKGEPFRWSCLLSPDFLKVLIVPVLFHTIWDWFSILAVVPLTILILMLLYAFTRRGVAEINQIVRESREDAVESEIPA